MSAAISAITLEGPKAMSVGPEFRMLAGRNQGDRKQSQLGVDNR